MFISLIQSSLCPKKVETHRNIAAWRVKNWKGRFWFLFSYLVLWCSLLLAAAQRYIHQLTINSFSSLWLLNSQSAWHFDFDHNQLYSLYFFYILPSARLSRRSLLVSMFSSASAAAADRIFLVSKVGCDYSLVDKIVSPDQWATRSIVVLLWLIW